MKLMIGEILQKINDAKGKNAKKKVLLDHQQDFYFIEFLKIAFDPTKKWVYTKKEYPKYKLDHAPYGHSLNSLIQETRRLYLFEINGPVNEKRRDEILIQIMESIYPYEAEILEAMLKGEKLPVAGLTINLLAEAYPNVFNIEPYITSGENKG